MASNNDEISKSNGEFWDDILDTQKEFVERDYDEDEREREKEKIKTQIKEEINKKQEIIVEKSIPQKNNKLIKVKKLKPQLNINENYYDDDTYYDEEYLTNLDY